jgi:hypothetical protein
MTVSFFYFWKKIVIPGAPSTLQPSANVLEPGADLCGGERGRPPQLKSGLHKYLPFSGEILNSGNVASAPAADFVADSNGWRSKVEEPANWSFGLC